MFISSISLGAATQAAHCHLAACMAAMFRSSLFARCFALSPSSPLLHSASPILRGFFQIKNTCIWYAYLENILDKKLI